MSNLCLFNKKGWEKISDLAELLNVKLMLIQSESVKNFRRKKLITNTYAYRQTPVDSRRYPSSIKRRKWEKKKN